MLKKTALITGGARGIGAAIARTLAGEGWELIINYLHSHARALDLAAELGARAVRADVSDHEQVRRMAEQLDDIDLLVCNAGVSHYGLLTDLEPEAWNHLFSVNAGGVYNCCRWIIPSMIRKKSGSIITISSVWGRYGASCEAAYAASKAAVIGLTLSLAKELGPSGIRVNCVAPGAVETRMLDSFSGEEKEALALNTPLTRLGTPWDVAQAVSFLASDKADFITGQVIGADGGLGL